MYLYICISKLSEENSSRLLLQRETVCSGTGFFFREIDVRVNNDRAKFGLGCVQCVWSYIHDLQSVCEYSREIFDLCTILIYIHSFLYIFYFEYRLEHWSWIDFDCSTHIARYCSIQNRWCFFCIRRKFHSVFILMAFDVRSGASLYILHDYSITYNISFRNLCLHKPLFKDPKQPEPAKLSIREHAIQCARIIPRVSSASRHHFERLPHQAIFSPRRLFPSNYEIDGKRSERRKRPSIYKQWRVTHNAAMARGQSWLFADHNKSHLPRQ